MKEETLFKYLGFQNYEEYQNFLDLQQTLKNKVINKFDFQKLSAQESESLKDDISSLIRTNYNVSDINVHTLNIWLMFLMIWGV